MYTHTMQQYFSIKKNEILPFATTWMELEGIILSEITQTEKDKCHEQNKQNRNRLLDTKRCRLLDMRGLVGWLRKMEGLRNTNW